jgi:hypothetical protein
VHERSTRLVHRPRLTVQNPKVDIVLGEQRCECQPGRTCADDQHVGSHTHRSRLDVDNQGATVEHSIRSALRSWKPSPGESSPSGHWDRRLSARLRVRLRAEGATPAGPPNVARGRGLRLMALWSHRPPFRVSSRRGSSDRCTLGRNPDKMASIMGITSCGSGVGTSCRALWLGQC